MRGRGLPWGCASPTNRVARTLADEVVSIFSARSSSLKRWPASLTSGSLTAARPTPHSCHPRSDRLRFVSGLLSRQATRQARRVRRRLARVIQVNAHRKSACTYRYI